MTPLKQEMLTELRKLDTATVATSLYILQISCAVAKVSTEPGEIPISGSEAALGILRSKLSMMTSESNNAPPQVAPLPGGDSYLCLTDGLDNSLQALTLNCDNADDARRNMARLDVLDSIRMLGQSMSYVVAGEPMVYAKNTFKLEVSNSMGDVVGRAGNLVLETSSAMPIGITTVYFEVPVLEHPDILSHVGAVFTDNPDATGRIRFLNVPDPESLATGRSLGIRYMDSSGRLVRLSNHEYRAFEKTLAADTPGLNGFFVLYSEIAPSPPPQPSPPPSPPPMPPSIPPPNPPLSPLSSSNDNSVGVGLIAGPVAAAVALCGLVACVYLRRRRGRLMQEIVPRDS